MLNQAIPVLIEVDDRDEYEGHARNILDRIRGGDLLVINVSDKWGIMLINKMLDARSIKRENVDPITRGKTFVFSSNYGHNVGGPLCNLVVGHTKFFAAANEQKYLGGVILLN